MFELTQDTTTLNPAPAAPSCPSPAPEPAAPRREPERKRPTPRRERVALPAQPWIRCPQDSTLIYFREFERGLKVCPACGHHFPLGARERLAQLLDPDTFEDLSGDIEPVDPLGFVDSKPYPQRVREAQKKTGEKEGVVFGVGALEGQQAVLAVMDFRFIGGAMGSAVGEGITRAVETARDRRLPLIVVCSSGGARMQEGCLSLMQMAKTSSALARLAEEGLPYLVVLADPTYGGVTASFAGLGDILIAEPNARIGFAGRSVVEGTLKEKLPPDFQRAEFLLEHGLIDMIVPRGELRDKLADILRYYTHACDEREQCPSALAEFEETDPPAPADAGRDVWDIVQLARHAKRPSMRQYIDRIFDEFHPLHGDRLFREDSAIVGGLARLGQLHCMVIGTQKGRTLKEKVANSFGMPHPEGYRKALRLMQHAARFRLPIITLIDTPGAYPGVGAEQRGQTLAIARNLLEMARLPVPVVAVLAGEGGSGGALALAVADRVVMQENAYFSVISPEGCSVILYKSVEEAPKAARALKITATDLRGLGVVDQIVPEPEGGAHTDVDAAARNLRDVLVTQLRPLLARHPEHLVEERERRYRDFGTPA